MTRLTCRLLMLGVAVALVTTCSPARPTPADPTPIPPSPTRPAAWTPTVETPPTAATTPVPTRALTPPATPASMKVVVAQANAFSIQIPSNWTVTEGTRRVQGNSNYEVKYFAAVGPGDAPQPGVIIFYEWPSSVAVTNDNVWESAFALTALVIKSCAMDLGPEKLPVEFGGEPTFGVEYVDACGAAGLVTGAVHGNVNYGALFEAPAPYFGEWFPTLREILLSITFER